LLTIEMLLMAMARAAIKGFSYRSIVGSVSISTITPAATLCLPSVMVPILSSTMPSSFFNRARY
jgi:hypothetical protein